MINVCSWDPVKNRMNKCEDTIAVQCDLVEGWYFGACPLAQLLFPYTSGTRAWAHTMSCRWREEEYIYIYIYKYTVEAPINSLYELFVDREI